MKLIFRYQQICLIIILLIGFLLRYYHYTTYPGRGATFDEYAWTWLGMNIIQNGIPISWSPHAPYTNREHYIEPSGAAFWLVQPYLEHPPLFGFIAGSWAMFLGARDMYSVELHHIRSLSLLLGVVSILAVYFFARELYGNTIALFSGLLYATIPTIVIGSRLLQNENFFIPFYILSILMIIRFINNKKSIVSSKYSYIISAVLCGLLTLSKVPWWGSAISCIFLLCSAKRYKQAGIFLSVVIIIFSLFFVWGYYWDSHLFFNLWSLQLTRYDITFDGLFSLFSHPYLVDRIYVDGWIYAGWFGLLINASRFKEHKYLLLGFLGYFAIYALGIPNEPGHGWYRYPFYPFLVISLSVVLFEAIKERSLLPFFMFTFIGTSLLQHTWEKIFGFSFQIYRFVLVLFGLTSITTVLTPKKLSSVPKYSSLTIIVLLIFLNILAVLIYKE